MGMTLINALQIALVLIVALYFWSLLRRQQGQRVAVKRESRRELDRLAHMREMRLTEPLSERTRPASIDDIVGQADGLKALRAALCGPNPQHVIIYGPPGVGKTAAARVILEEAKKNPRSPFTEDAVMIELDATTARFDERGIADPLIGSVHDPIYQGAGQLGAAGIPQPKPGAVTKAHGGVLFIDEIGELHPVQMNKLLKVLEDRRVFLESAYYSRDNTQIPAHIREVFEHGLPADFRLIGATTRLPEELPPALRSRCMEIFFRELTVAEVKTIAARAARRLDLELDEGSLNVIGRFARNGRDAVNIVQIAAGLAAAEGRDDVRQTDIEWVVYSGRYTPRPQAVIGDAPQVGVVNGLAVYGPNLGGVIELEVAARPATGERGEVRLTGLVDEEEFGGMGRPLKRRKSMARASVENVLTVLKTLLPDDPERFDLHVNFPGGMPVDGPSAGVAMAVGIASAITGLPVRHDLAMTGEVSVRGRVKPVGGVVAKLQAARDAGITRVLIPAENEQLLFKAWRDLEVTPIRTVREALCLALVGELVLLDSAPATRYADLTDPVQRTAHAYSATAVKGSSRPLRP